MISLTDVTKRYDNTTVVDRLNLQINQGEIVGIIGHNGAGKSTTMKMIAGLIEPTSGDVHVMGQDMVKHSIKVKQRIGYLPEESPLYEAMTAQQYLLFFSELYQMPRHKALSRIDGLLQSLGLEQSNKLTGEFSKGMKRKTAIARTLLHDPELLILDEPNSGLDPLTSFFIINYLKQLKNEGKTILLSAHNLFHVETICDRVAIIKNGKLLVFDTMDAIRGRLGKREYQVIFHSDDPLEYEHVGGNYVFRTHDVDGIAHMLETVSTKGWTLVDLSMRESALEEIYVKLMTS
ncbi:MAG TPA: ABC transporter ATP-binding protein [Anaerolineales bacterium]|nr:ABC transporter ATP-binding protein [Anaerolineales bacterium]HNA89029.1 ABC transporter ATP-binding protein [Anaerolineales bacterium]HNB36883.1 ABC transporter ATP-binding protein [Anaerolineales bacterium]HNC07953.1 ABC transporter ATP-binding protein [Anaerolineales bacterium]